MAIKFIYRGSQLKYKRKVRLIPVFELKVAKWKKENRLESNEL